LAEAILRQLALRPFHFGLGSGSEGEGQAGFRNAGEMTNSSTIDGDVPQRHRRRAASPPGGRSSERREQQRSIETRIAILTAALAEFAENGYDAASTRNIGRRAGIHNTLLTYHFLNKEALWRATAEHFFAEIAAQLGQTAAYDPSLPPIDKLREEFRSFFRFIVARPDFHQFMIRESQPGNPRLPWLIETFIRPIMTRTLPLIQAAQQAGQLPQGHPVLLYYFLVSILTVLSAHSAEIELHSGDNPLALDRAEQYWALVDQMVFAGGGAHPAAD